MSLFTQFKTDEALERAGVLLQYGDASNGKPICIRIARSGGGNVPFTKRMEAVFKPYRRQLQTETIQTEQVQKLLRKVYAETVVLGWENVEFPVLDAATGQPVVNEDGTPKMEFRAYTVDNCVQLFDMLPDLYADIEEQSKRAALFREAVLEGEAKN